MKFVQLQRSGLIASRNALAVAKAAIIKAREKEASWVFIFCPLLMIASLIRMWGHWLEISVSLGFYRTAGVLVGITGAALVASWWVSTDND